MSFHLVCQNLLLRLVAMLEELLYNIISKDVCHQLQTIALNLTENLLLFVTVCRLQFLLDETRSMLITTEFDDVVVDVLMYCQSRGNLEKCATNGYLKLITFIALTIRPKLLQDWTSHSLGWIVVAVAPTCQGGGAKLGDRIESRQSIHS